MSDTQSQAERDTLLTVRDLRISVGDVEVVHGVDFEVGRGEVVALVGESGAGKSMTAMSIPRLLPPGGAPTGSIRFDGAELVDLSDDRIRRYRGAEIACVYQEPMTALNPLRTIGDFLNEAIGAHLTSENKGRARHPMELLEAVGLGQQEGLLDRYPHQLSGGQRQRVMAAGAVAWKPKLLIADEPTTALDVTTQRQVLTMFRELVQHERMSMIFVTHDMGVVADIADRVVVMRGGEVVETGEVFSIFENPQHDYTKMLLGAARALHGEDLGTEPGERQSDDRQQTDIRNDRPNEPALTTSNLTVQYRARGWRKNRQGKTAVREAALQVARGETLGVVGESGSGKSTIARSILGLTPITAGRIELDGVDLVGQTRRQRRRALSRIGVVFQDPNSSLDPSLPLWRIVTEPLWRSGQVKDQRKLRARAVELLESVELDGTWLDRRRHQLSGGQRQRVAIARAISHSPDLLIADEPTSALDVTVQVKVLELLQRLQRELGFACVFISHDLYVVSTISDRVLVMKDGQVVETGPTNEVLGRPKSDYTKTLIAAIPVPDPREQRARQHAA